jgi:hypothetical protein
MHLTVPGRFATAHDDTPPESRVSDVAGGAREDAGQTRTDTLAAADTFPAPSNAETVRVGALGELGCVNKTQLRCLTVLGAVVRNPVPGATPTLSVDALQDRSPVEFFLSDLPDIDPGAVGAVVSKLGTVTVTDAAADTFVARP